MYQLIFTFFVQLNFMKLVRKCYTKLIERFPSLLFVFISVKQNKSVKSPLIFHCVTIDI